MGKLLSRFRRKDEPPDATGLTPREKKAVRAVWSTFCKEHPDYGVLLFQAYFHKYPDHIELFRHFKGKNLRTLGMDQEFSSHCSLVGEEITNIVEALDNVPELLELLEKNALLHHHIRGVTPAHFASFGQVLVDVLHANHEDIMTTTTEEAWKKFFEFVVLFITTAYDKANKTVRGSTGSSYKLATMSTSDVQQRAGSGPSTEPDKATASDATATGAAARRVSLTDGKNAGVAVGDSRRHSTTRKAGEDIHLAGRRTSLSAGSHGPPTGERPSVPDTGAATAAAGTTVATSSSMHLNRRRSSTKSLTDLAGKKSTDATSTSSAPVLKRKASNPTLGEGPDVKPSEDRSAASDKSGASHQRSLSKRSSSKISLKGKPK
ncbi:hypothetical protein HPB49_008479 [Dermacentor silvarum]|uniref:Uncharacterized protein n=1 Tax=Dermacentor silvarum TaxID=543639 RepID=A0ACB8DBX0_DERSI|nr:hypothetical protein HPB49_008479 [Dermacentor silvarum]